MEMASNLSVDIISTFPDDVLGLILSFLSSKEAVQTSILSKRWMHAWTFASKIKISDSSLNEFNPHFAVFTYNVLRRNCVRCLDELELDITVNPNPRNLRNWMNHASLRDAVNLSLHFPINIYSRMPTQFFSSNKLESISIGGGIVLNAPKSVHFPRLKSLDLYNVHFFDDESLVNILAGSPVLLILQITRNRLDTINTLSIHSNSLSFLLLDCFEMVPFNVNDVSVVIRTPNLLAFHIYDWSPMEFKVDNFPSLLHANISISEGLSSNDNTLAGLLRKVSSAECLSLEGNTFQFLSTVSLDNLPLFNKLTKLNVRFNQSSGKVWISILASAPNLKVLKFVKKFTHHESCEWHSTPYASHGLSSSVEVVKFSGFGGCPAEMDLVAYILKNARVLKKMKITLYGIADETLMIYEELQKLPKVSLQCQLVIH